MDKKLLTDSRNELSIFFKNGINFTLAAAIIWAIIAIIWQLPYSAYNRSIFVFMAGAPLLPLAFLFSKIFKTGWQLPSNGLQPLGLWLNFAQLFYFPFLILVLLKIPQYFVVTYAIITGAHFFPFAWFYNTRWYAVFAGLVSVGALLLSLYLSAENQWWVALFTSTCLLVLTLLLFLDVKNKRSKQVAP